MAAAGPTAGECMPTDAWDAGAAYTPAVPVATIVQALPYVNWILLVSLAVGAFAFVALARELSDATRGYLGFTAFSAALLAALALLSDFSLPAPAGLAIVEPPSTLTAARQISLGAFAVLAIVYVIALRRRRRTWPIGVLALVAAATTLIAAAVGWAPTLPDSLPLLVQLGTLSAATGGVLAALVLGHWYLVTPRLSERPLVLGARVLTVVVATQIALFVVWTTVAGGPRQEPFASLTGGPVVFVWLRFAVGLAFPLALAWMAMRTAMTRSMESATGLLYLALAAVTSGTIAAAALYVGSGLLV